MGRVHIVISFPHHLDFQINCHWAVGFSSRDFQGKLSSVLPWHLSVSKSFSGMSSVSTTLPLIKWWCGLAVWRLRQNSLWAVRGRGGDFSGEQRIQWDTWASPASFSHVRPQNFLLLPSDTLSVSRDKRKSFFQTSLTTSAMSLCMNINQGDSEGDGSPLSCKKKMVAHGSNKSK